MIGNNDHGMFNKSIFSVFEYYTISKFIYKHMTKLSGRPNRYTPDVYITKFNKAGFKKIKIYGYKNFQGKYYKQFPEYTQINLNDFSTIIKKLKIQKKHFSKEYKQKEDKEFFFDYFILVAQN